jgi:hypothetical protein
MLFRVYFEHCYFDKTLVERATRTMLSLGNATTKCTDALGEPSGAICALHKRGLHQLILQVVIPTIRYSGQNRKSAVATRIKPNPMLP